MGTINPVRNYMSFTPIHIQVECTTEEAANLMADKNISHLPVLCRGKICGIISHEDVKAALVSPLNLQIKDIMNENVIMMLPSTSVKVALQKMLENKISSVVVHEVDGSIVGIFTSTDAMLVLNSMIDFLEGDLIKARFWNFLNKEFNSVKNGFKRLLA
ncbi:MAG: CBS domain-containing protein [Bdellovibrionota bacterium]|nr:CBS domain-containing protein [Bdellovibrionota bacterium]